jgi:ElaB/YqjD/DUF883 family membrane-anchored ribosome-binding protein
VKEKYGEITDDELQRAEGNADTSRAVRRGSEQVAQRTRQSDEQTADMVAHRPLESIIAALSVGLISGIAIGLSLGAKRRPEPTWRDCWTR